VKGFRAAVGFTTTIPVKVREGDYDCLLSRVYLFVPAGLLIGVLIGIAGLAFQWLLPPSFAAALTVVCIYALTGINHIDGLSDTADGLATSGPREKKIRSMKDVHAGAGGILVIGLDLLIICALISDFAGSGYRLFYPLFVAEICAKVAVITVITFGKSLGPGMGAMAIAGAKKSHFMAGFIFAAVAISLVTFVIAMQNQGNFAWYLGLAGFAAILSPLVVAVVLMRIADRNFGGVNGDVMGAANEIGRIAALMVMGVIIWMPF
jgi:adenosylcobinamide-GDP ribazoletransferase